MIRLVYHDRAGGLLSWCSLMNGWQFWAVVIQSLTKLAWPGVVVLGFWAMRKRLPKLVEQVFHLIDKLHRDGMTILLVEQNVMKALKVADRMYLIRMGMVEASGTPEQLRRSVDLESSYLGGLNPLPGAA